MEKTRHATNEIFLDRLAMDHFGKAPNFAQNNYITISRYLRSQKQNKINQQIASKFRQNLQDFPNGVMMTNPQGYQIRINRATDGAFPKILVTKNGIVYSTDTLLFVSRTLAFQK
jgi:hypothetical protein